GNTLAGTAEAEATNAVATANAAGGTNLEATATKSSGGTTSEATATTASSGGAPTAAATEAGSGGGGTANGGPRDVPGLKGDNTILLINQQLVSYQTKVSFADTVKF